jgi:hypothetical protein
MTDVNDQQFAAVMALPAPDRYAYFLRSVGASEELWTLRSEEDFVVFTDDDHRDLMPVWPARRFAEACSQASSEETRAFKIDLNRWLAAWTPSMETEGRLIAVFPLPNDQGEVVSPAKLAEDLTA